MIDRYSTPEMAAVWADTTRFGRWLEVELLATEAHAALGVVPAADAAACRDRAPVVDDAFVAAVLERERTTDHDVAAFVDVVQAAHRRARRRVDPLRADVVATSSTPRCAGRMRDAVDLVLDATDELLTTLVEHGPAPTCDTVMIGRTHGIHAEPTTFGAKVALWALQLERDRTRLARRPRGGRRVQAVGRRRHVLQRRAGRRALTSASGSACARCRRRRSSPATATPSSCRRCASTAATCELVAVELRHLQRTEVARGPRGLQAGSEGLVGDAPQAQPDLGRDDQRSGPRRSRPTCRPALQDVALWHERDISHSSVERIVLPDSSMLVHYMAATTEPVAGATLQVDEERMRDEPVVEPWPGVQPAGAAGAGGGRR